MGARDILKGASFVKQTSFRQKEEFSTFSDEVCDLLDNLIAWDPATRLSSIGVLEHKYFQDFSHCGNFYELLHDPNDEPSAPCNFDCSFESFEDKIGAQEWQQLCITLIDEFVR